MTVDNFLKIINDPGFQALSVQVFMWIGGGIGTGVAAALGGHKAVKAVNASRKAKSDPPV